jgi:hypothetical protein
MGQTPRNTHSTAPSPWQLASSGHHHATNTQHSTLPLAARLIGQSPHHKHTAQHAIKPSAQHPALGSSPHRAITTAQTHSIAPCPSQLASSGNHHTTNTQHLALGSSPHRANTTPQTHSTARSPRHLPHWARTPRHTHSLTCFACCYFQ